MNTRDRDVLRSLAARVREIATPRHCADVSALYTSLNALKPQRPVVLINELPWNQLEAASDFLKLRCEGEFERGAGCCISGITSAATCWSSRTMT